MLNKELSDDLMWFEAMCGFELTNYRNIEVIAHGDARHACGHKGKESSFVA
jgi:hypothetical protein